MDKEAVVFRRRLDEMALVHGARGRHLLRLRVLATRQPRSAAVNVAYIAKKLVVLSRVDHFE